jgi:succinate dehydrogenase / fumarate reductase membrane anchor subunit
MDMENKPHKNKSSREGVSHWWMQRLTAMALIPLVIYFIIGLLMNIKADHAAAVLWLSSPVNTAVTVLLFGVGFYHANLGVQVIVEDYVSNQTYRRIILAVVKLKMIALALLSIFSVFFIVFG